MKACVLVGPKMTQIKEVASPVMGEGDVLVKVRACGVCRSEINQWQGAGDQSWHEAGAGPVILGHEPSGIIENVGRGVRGFHKGQPVAVFTGGPGYYTEYTSGGFAEYLSVAQENVVVIPDGTPFEHALGEPLACLVSAFERTRIDLSHRVALIGCGFMGLALLQLVRMRNPREIVAIDVSREALGHALRMGADRACTPDELGQADRAARWEDKDNGFDVVIEVSGAQKALSLAGDIARAHGSLSIVGYHDDGIRQIDVGLWNVKALTVVNAHEKRRAYFMECMKNGIGLVAKGKLDMKSLVSHTYPAAELDRAYEDLLNKAHGHIKGVVVL